MRLGRYGLNEVDDVEDVASDIEVDIEVDIDVDIDVDDVDDVYGLWFQCVGGCVWFFKNFPSPPDDEKADNLELVILKKKSIKNKKNVTSGQGKNLQIVDLVK